MASHEYRFFLFLTSSVPQTGTQLLIQSIEHLFLPLVNFFVGQGMVGRLVDNAYGERFPALRYLPNPIEVKKSYSGY